MKNCKLCGGVLAPGSFYKGVPNVHKECHAARVREHRAANVEYFREYDRGRSMRPDRVAARAAYAETERGREVSAEAKRKWQQNNQEKRAAHVILGNAVRDGKIEKPSTCQRCKEPTYSRRLHAHHHDYAKPLDVEWICAKCHREEHS